MPRCLFPFKVTVISACVLLGIALYVSVAYLRIRSGEFGAAHGYHADIAEQALSMLRNRNSIKRSLSTDRRNHKPQPYHSPGASSVEVGEPSQQNGRSKGLSQGAHETYLPPTPSLTLQSIEDVQAFVFFVGYPRSGHSIIASLIDAHPNAILAHEFNLFAKLAVQLSVQQEFLLNRSNLFNALYRDSYVEATSGWRSGNSSYDKKGYTLKLDASLSWQGRFSTLKVIGDKAGGSTARVFRGNPQLFQQMYSSLVDSVRVPMRVIHVVRNPYDMIATRLLYRVSGERRRKAQFNVTYKLNNERIMSQASKGLYSEAKAVHDMITACHLTVLEIHNVDFVENTRTQMELVCKFLGLSCSESYLQMCEQVSYNHVSRTRDSLEWSQQARKFVSANILTFPFFRRYSFETD